MGGAGLRWTAAQDAATADTGAAAAADGGSAGDGDADAAGAADDGAAGAGAFRGTPDIPARLLPEPQRPVRTHPSLTVWVRQPMMMMQPMMMQQPMMMMQPMMMQPTVPPLEHFLGASSFLTVKQEVEMLEVIVGFETENEYKIIGIDASTMQPGQIGKAFEQSDCCTRQVCGPQREFEMRIQCAYGAGPKLDVLRLERPFRSYQ